MYEGMMKHTGLLNNTGKNVVVVFMSLPEEPDQALVIDTDALPDSYNESLRKVVESVEAQQSKNLADVLARRMSADGSNTTMLQKFHMAGRLMKVPVANVSMVPKRGLMWPLSEVLKTMQADTDAPVGFDDLDAETKAAVAADLKRFNMHAHNKEGETTEGVKGNAAALLEMAKLLEADAQNKREQAYRMDPSLAPKLKRNAQPTIDVSPVEATINPADSVVETTVVPTATVEKTTKKPRRIPTTGVTA
jgi:hypothetical protein